MCAATSMPSKFFGGVPKDVRIDNLKSAILKASFYEPIYQINYKQFADYYKFSPIPCRIYRPNDKGKVESGIKFVKGNFFKGRTFVSGADLERKLREWNNSANKRVHGTTRKVPLEVFISGRKILPGIPSSSKIFASKNIYKKSLP